ncbi:MAG: hypothetical protein LC808_37980, partial [Actinobacteria bacterium]|nr:hypothetical protein [Actinomycetota bacterium]
VPGGAGATGTTTSNLYDPDQATRTGAPRDTRAAAEHVDQNLGPQSKACPPRGSTLLWWTG